MKGRGTKTLPDLNRALDIYKIETNKEKLTEVMEAGKGLVIHFAKIFSGDYLSDDLIQVGYEGLLKAVDRFDPEKGVTFVTYASHCIMSEMRHELRKEKSFYCPVWMAELQAKIIKATDEYMKVNNAMPSIDDIAEMVNFKREGVVQAMRAGRVPFEELDLSQMKSISYHPFKLPLEDKIVLQEAIRKLNHLQRSVIFYIFYRDMTQTQVAEELDMNQRRVSRILKKAIDTLSKEMN